NPGPWTHTATSGCRDDRDVFQEYNRAVSLDTVERWHTEKGHQVTGRENGRIEFVRDGKDSGQSFNVKVIDGVAVAYNLSTNAGMPAGRGLSPSQVRCFYLTGSCDTSSMNTFAEVLKKEMGWDKPPPVAPDDGPIKLGDLIARNPMLRPVVIEGLLRVGET